MVFNQINHNVQNAQGTRCQRKKRPPNPYPPYFEANYYSDPDQTTIQYHYTDTQGNMRQGLMGNRMEVILLPGAFLRRGSQPGQDQLEPITSFLRTKYPNDEFIKGHMWNEEIGGQGVTENLVPLTSRANSSHKNHAEKPLKHALENFGNFYYSLKNKSYHPDYDLVYGFRYVVEIEGDGNGGFKPWGGVEEGIVPNSIHVQVFPLKCDRHGIFSYDNFIINTAINQLTKPLIERLINGIWIDQNGCVFDA